MVKFAKLLEQSLVPEWKDAYCNYKVLKRDTKKVKEGRSQKIPNGNASIEENFTLTRTLTRTLSQLATIKSNVENQIKLVGSSGRLSLGRARSGGLEALRPEDFLVVHRIEADCHGDPQFEQYETELLDPLQPDEADRQFFKRLDAQLNKVNYFYKMKEAQYIDRAKRLEQQLLNLFQVQEEHARQRQMLGPKTKEHDSDDGEEDDDDNDDNEGDGFGLSESFQANESPLLQSIVTVKSGEYLSRVIEANADDEEDEERQYSANEKMVTFKEGAERITEPKAEPAVTQSNPQEGYGSSTTSLNTSEPQLRRAGSHNHAVNGDESPFLSVVKKADFRSRLLPDVRVTVDNDDEDEDDEEAQRSKFKYIFKEPKTAIQDLIDMSLSKKKLVTSEKMLCKAFIEFYRGLNLLKSFSSLNLVAFAKIMKKYDKAVKLRLGPVYLKLVERSYFATSNKVTNLMLRVEDIFTKNFSSHDRRKAMAKLRPQRQHSGHMTTFFVGIFSGVSMLLLAIFIVLLCVSPEVRAWGDVRYMNTVFYVFSSLGLVLLHMYMYGWNLYAWQQTRINYAFIFEHRLGTELRYRQVLCLASGFTSLLLAAMNFHLYISTKEAPKFKISEFIPLAAVLIFITALLHQSTCCIDLHEHFSSDACITSFLHHFTRYMMVPFNYILEIYFENQVVLADFFLGDQLTSQVFLFRNIEFMLCYYSSGFFLDRVNGGCGTKNPFRELMYFFSVLPYWLRFLQCLRRYRDEGDKVQLWNAGKYGSTLIAVVFKTRYVERGTSIWLVMFIFFSTIAMFYQLYWDLVIDWGLLQRHSQNPWLRDQLILEKKYLYFISMAVNTVLRVAWLSSIQMFNFIPGLNRPGWDSIFAALEVIRRGHWNFYRLENEHLNNVGKYRAVKSVPLPFDESDGAFL